MGRRKKQKREVLDLTVQDLWCEKCRDVKTHKQGKTPGRFKCPCGNTRFAAMFVPEGQLAKQSEDKEFILHVRLP